MTDRYQDACAVLLQFAAHHDAQAEQHERERQALAEGTAEWEARTRQVWQERAIAGAYRYALDPLVLPDNDSAATTLAESAHWHDQRAAEYHQAAQQASGSVAWLGLNADEFTERAIARVYRHALGLLTEREASG
jgi:hypothetical protein